MGTPVWKEVLCQGRVFDPGTRQWHAFTPRDIRDAHRNFQKMKKRGIPVPACWEHQDIEAGDAPVDDALRLAEWKRRYARYTFGFHTDSRINDRGNLDMLIDVDDPADVPVLKRVRGISPKVYRDGYWDSLGGEYRGMTVVHGAATPTPRQHYQRPFFHLSDADAFYLSYLPDGEPGASPGKGIDTDPAPRPAPAPAPKNPAPFPGYAPPADEWTFTAWLAEARRAAGLNMSTTEPPEGSPVADDSDDKGGKKEPEGGGNADLKAVVKAIRDAFGAKISDKVSNWTELVIALESNGAGGVGDADADDAPADAAPDAATVPGGGAPMMMSSFDAETRQSIKDELADVRKRIDAAIKDGKVPAFKGRQWHRALNPAALKLSVTDDGALTGPRYDAVLKELAEAEGKRKAGVSLSTTPAAAPGELVGAGAGGEALGDWIVKGGPLPAKK